MPELAIPYIVVGPDGHEAVINNPASPNYVGRLDVEAGGIVGLEAAESRGGAEPVVEGDGAVLGDWYLGERPMVLNALILDPDTATANARESRIKRATRATVGDGRLRWTPTGQTLERYLTFRRSGPPRITGVLPRKVQVNLISGMPYALSSVEAQIASAVAAGTNATWTNQGDAPTLPRFRVFGPTTGQIVLRNVTTGAVWRMKATLPAMASGDFLDIDFDNKTVVKNNTTSQYDFYDFAGSSWWALGPGSSQVRLDVGAGASATYSAWARHSWE